MCAEKEVASKIEWIKYFVYSNFHNHWEIVKNSSGTVTDRIIGVFPRPALYEILYFNVIYFQGFKYVFFSRTITGIIVEF